MSDWMTFNAWARCCCPGCVLFRFSARHYQSDPGGSYPTFDVPSLYTQFDGTNPYYPGESFCGALSNIPYLHLGTGARLNGPQILFRHEVGTELPGLYAEVMLRDGFTPNVILELEETCGDGLTKYEVDINFGTLFGGDPDESDSFHLTVIFGPCPCDKGADCFCCDTSIGVVFDLSSCGFTHFLVGVGWNPVTKVWQMTGGDPISGLYSTLAYANGLLGGVDIFRVYMQINCAGVMSGKIYFLGNSGSLSPDPTVDTYPPDPDRLLCEFSTSLSSDEECNFTFTVSGTQGTLGEAIGGTCCEMTGSGSGGSPPPHYVYVFQTTVLLDENAGPATETMPDTNLGFAVNLYQVGSSTVWAGSVTFWTTVHTPFVPANTAIRLEVTFDTSDNSVGVGAFNDLAGTQVSLLAALPSSIIRASPLIAEYAAASYTPAGGALFAVATVFYPVTRIYQAAV